MRLADLRDLLTVGQLVRKPDGVDKHDTLVLLPRVRRAQNGKKRTDAGAGGETPQDVGRWYLGDREEAVRARQQPDRIARLERGELRRQRAPGKGDEIELMGLNVRTVHEGVRATDHLLLRSGGR